MMGKAKGKAQRGHLSTGPLTIEHPGIALPCQRASEAVCRLTTTGRQFILPSVWGSVRRHRWADGGTVCQRPSAASLAALGNTPS